MDKTSIFLHFYFYFLEQELANHKRELAAIKFQSEEANTDEFVKLFMQKFIKDHDRVPSDYPLKTLTIKVDDRAENHSVSEIESCYINEVYRPEELSTKQKAIIAASKHSVYTNPDLYLEIKIDEESVYSSVELKTTKNNTIPGSSVQQVDPYEWVIFIKHNIHGVEVACGYYMNTITEKLPFPDRSPRPLIGFDNLKNWNRSSRILRTNNLTYEYKKEERDNKLLCIENWQKILCNEWMKTIQSNKTRTEKWFNNTIRMFSLDLLNLIRSNPTKLEELINLLERNVKSD